MSNSSQLYVLPTSAEVEPKPRSSTPLARAEWEPLQHQRERRGSRPAPSYSSRTSSLRTATRLAHAADPGDGTCRSPRNGCRSPGALALPSVVLLARTRRFHGRRSGTASSSRATRLPRLAPRMAERRGAASCERTDGAAGPCFSLARALPEGWSGLDRHRR